MLSESEASKAIAPVWLASDASLSLSMTWHCQFSTGWSERLAHSLVALVGQFQFLDGYFVVARIRAWPGQLAGPGVGEVPLGDGGSLLVVHRSEERRVGKECRSRWSPYH